MFCNNKTRILQDPYEVLSICTDVFHLINRVHRWLWYNYALVNYRHIRFISIYILIKKLDILNLFSREFRSSNKLYVYWIFPVSWHSLYDLYVKIAKRSADRIVYFQFTLQIVEKAWLYTLYRVAENHIRVTIIYKHWYVIFFLYWPGILNVK